ncbi:MAG: hypothetical protein ACJA2B_001537 [Candidatus Endobugula sp.]|jgi:hypothetical protein
MKKLTLFTTILFLGVFIGWYAKFYQFYSYVDYDQEVDKQLNIFSGYTSEYIRSENFSCENETEKNVGKLFMGMVSDSTAHKSNTLSADCDELICTITYNYCKPWQTSECGSRILFYEKAVNDKILSGSFKCIDVP